MSCFGNAPFRLQNATSMPCINDNRRFPMMMDQSGGNCGCNCNCGVKPVVGTICPCACHKNHNCNAGSNNLMNMNNMCNVHGRNCSFRCNNGNNMNAGNDYATIQFTGNANIPPNPNHITTDVDWIQPSYVETPATGENLQQLRSYDMADVHHPIPPMLMNPGSMLTRSQSLSCISQQNNEMNVEPMPVYLPLESNTFPCKCNNEKSIVIETDDLSCPRCGGKRSTHKECTFESKSTKDRIANIRRFWTSKECLRSSDKRVSIEKQYDEENSRIMVKHKPECSCHEIDKEIEYTHGSDCCHKCGLPPRPRRFGVRRSETVRCKTRSPIESRGKTIIVTRQHHSASDREHEVGHKRSPRNSGRIMGGSLGRGGSFLSRGSLDIDRTRRDMSIDIDKYLKPSGERDTFNHGERYYYVDDRDRMDDFEPDSINSMNMGNTIIEHRVLSPKISVGGGNQNSYISSRVVRTNPNLEDSRTVYTPKSDLRTPGGVTYSVDMSRRSRRQSGHSYRSVSHLSNMELAQRYERSSMEVEQILRDRIDQCENDLRAHRHNMSNEVASTIRVAIVRANSLIDDQLKMMHNFCSLLEDGRFESEYDRIPSGYEVSRTGLLDYWEDIQSKIDDVESAFHRIDRMRENNWTIPSSYSTFG